MTTEELDLDGANDKATGEESPDYTAATAEAVAEEEALWAAEEPPPKDAALPPNDPTPPPEEASPEQKAANLRDAVPAAYLYGAATGMFKDNIDVASCQAYLRTLLQDAGDPADLIVQMLIEQLAMAHHTLGRLHFRAALREGLAEVVAYHSALARLMSEFRKSSLALQSLRQSAGGAQVRPP